MPGNSRDQTQHPISRHGRQPLKNPPPNLAISNALNSNSICQRAHTVTPHRFCLALVSKLYTGTLAHQDRQSQPGQAFLHNGCLKKTPSASASASLDALLTAAVRLFRWQRHGTIDKL